MRLTIRDAAKSFNQITRLQIVLGRHALLVGRPQTLEKFDLLARSSRRQEVFHYRSLSPNARLSLHHNLRRNERVDAFATQQNVVVDRDANGVLVRDALYRVDDLHQRSIVCRVPVDL